MSALAAVVAAAPSTATDDLRNVAGLASLTLALIGFFTTLRVNALRDKSIGAWGWATFRDWALPEVLLLSVAVVALLTMAPLLDAFRLSQFMRHAGALPTMFALIWFGFVGIAGIELWLIGSRMSTAWGNRT